MALNTINPHTDLGKTAKHFDECKMHYAGNVFKWMLPGTAKFNLKWNDFSNRLFKEYYQSRNY
jgi:hypothetical protein